jgi:hypothetical protein
MPAHASTIMPTKMPRNSTVFFWSVGSMSISSCVIGGARLGLIEATTMM